MSRHANRRQRGEKTCTLVQEIHGGRYQTRENIHRRFIDIDIREIDQLIDVYTDVSICREALSFLLDI